MRKRTMARGILAALVALGVGVAVPPVVAPVEAAVTVKTLAEGKRVVFDTLPVSAADIFPCHTPEEAAALTVAALTRFSEEPAAGIAMLNALKGPQPLSAHDIQLLKDQLLGERNYVARSHFEGATPENDYTPAQPYAVVVYENPYSYTEENYARLFVRSGGADSLRPVTLRRKPSTGEWFLWNHVGLLPGIRIPASKDAWR